MTEERASTSPKRTAVGEDRSSKSKKLAKSAMAKCETSDELAASLVGSPFHFLHDLVRSQPFPVAQVTIDHSRTMLDLFNQKLQKSESLKKYDNGVVIDNETNTYIPSSVRKQDPLVTVPSILNDNRKPDGTPIAAAREVMDEFGKAHKLYLEAAGKACHELLKLSIKEISIDIMECTFDALYDLALAETNIYNPALPANATYTQEDIALRASLDIISSEVHLTDDDFKLLMSDEVTNITNADNRRETAGNKFVACINKFWPNQEDFDKVTVLQKFGDADQTVVNNIAGKVVDPFKRATAGVLRNRNNMVEQSRESNDLAELFAKKKIDKTNQAIAMDIDSDEAVAEKLIEASRAAARKEVNKMKRQMEAKERKKSSAAESDAHGLQRTSPGRNGKGGGKGSGKQQQKKQSKLQRERSPTRSTPRWSKKNESQTYSPEQPASILRRGGRFEGSRQSQSWNNSEESSQRTGRHRNKRGGRGGSSRGNQGGRRGRN